VTPSFPFVPAAALLALLLAAPSSVAAQSQEATPPTGREAAAAELAFEREVFAYPVFQRRNPFAPLLANGAAGPRFEIMRLEGILYDPDPRFSLALIAAGRVDPDQQRQNQGDPLGLAPPAGQVGGPGEATVQGDVSEQGVQQEAAPERTRPAGVARSLRVGERWGNIRVVEIRPDVVVVDVEEFGVAERKIMRLADERSQGGSS
jgi:hypothetical protein